MQLQRVVELSLRRTPDRAHQQVSAQCLQARAHPDLGRGQSAIQEGPPGALLPCAAGGSEHPVLIVVQVPGVGKRPVVQQEGCHEEGARQSKVSVVLVVEPSCFVYEVLEFIKALCLRVPESNLPISLRQDCLTAREVAEVKDPHSVLNPVLFNHSVDDSETVSGRQVHCRMRHDPLDALLNTGDEPALLGLSHHSDLR